MDGTQEVSEAPARMSDEELASLAALEKAATPAPWFARGLGPGAPSVHAGTGAPDEPVFANESGWRCSDCGAIEDKLGKARPAEPGCYDCGLPYASDAWCDAVVSDETWRRLSPTGDSGGLLCFSCMTRRAVRLGLKDEPITIRSGPWQRAPYSQRLVKLRAALEDAHVLLVRCGGYGTRPAIKAKVREALARDEK